MRPKTNGCGPAWYPKIWKDGYFEKECALHDAAYIQGYDRIEADTAFLKSMLKKTEGNRLRRAQAWFFFILVILFGWMHHKRGLDL